MKCPKSFFYILLILLTACSSKLRIAGQEHALVFKKWQSLAEYARDTLSNEPIYIVATFNVEKSEAGSNFTLGDFQLTNQELSNQINLITPDFRNKVICKTKCIFLTEYLKSNAINATMLSRYYDKYEYELFKLYGDIFTLRNSIDEIKSADTKSYQQYINWIISTSPRFDDIQSLREYLVETFSVKGFTAFMQDIPLKFAHLMDSSEDVMHVWKDPEFGIFRGQLKNEPSKYWVVDEAFIDTSENWKEYNEESFDWLINNAQTNDFNWIINSDNNIDVITANVGDIACVLDSNEFGQITAQRGKLMTVSMIGKVSIIEDGIKTSQISDDAFQTDTLKTFTPIEGFKTFLSDKITLCELY